MTSNPTIFQNAIAKSDLYDDDIRSAGREGPRPRSSSSLAVTDVRAAADQFRPVFDAADGSDGFVSIEVGPRTKPATRRARSPRRAASGRRAARANVMVKIPGTAEGVPAIRQCLSEGININVTLLFGVPRYREVMEAYLSALEERVKKGEPIDRIRSVASFFVSRVDTNVDAKLDALIAKGNAAAKPLRGEDRRSPTPAWPTRPSRRCSAGSRFAALKAKGARVQKPLWASTSTKDKTLPDVYYVEALIAPDSVDTVPPETFEAYRDHGNPKVRIHDDLDARARGLRGAAGARDRFRHGHPGARGRRRQEVLGLLRQPPSGDRGQGEGDEGRLSESGSTDSVLVTVPRRTEEEIRPPCTLVIFGASGDLTHRLLAPAIAHLNRDGAVSPDFAIIGIGRTEYSDDDFRRRLEDGAKEFTPPTQGRPGRPAGRSSSTFRAPSRIGSSIGS